MDEQVRARLDEVILKACDLPVLPATAQQVLLLMQDPDVSIEKVKKVIGSDPGLTARILKISNSSFYGGGRDIGNLTQALMRLGLSTVRSIMLAASMKHVYKRFGLTEKLLWEDSVGSAVASRVIAAASGFGGVEDAFVGGLLHNVGMVILNNEYPDVFVELMARVYNEGLEFEEVELDTFGFTHYEVGALVVRKWGFPRNVQMLLAWFGDEEKLSDEPELAAMARIIALADKFCHKLAVGWRRQLPGKPDLSMELSALEIDEEKAEELAAHIEEAIREEVALC
ncbi:MAG TPA: HDOD domain-containing protein [Deltaproteobacteria bacterium]|nr:HDOD domain-containing protein [Deltaproteobacteria bacterium]